MESEIVWSSWPMGIRSAINRLLMRPAKSSGKSVSDQAVNYLFSKVPILELIWEMAI